MALAAASPAVGDSHVLPFPASRYVYQAGQVPTIVPARIASVTEVMVLRREEAMLLAGLPNMLK